MPPQLQEDNRLLARSEEIKFSGSEQKAVQQMMHHFFDSYLLATSFTGENLYNDLLHTLQTTYHLKNFPYRMECIDISHISGDWTSGGLSCMVGGLLEKKGYRKYKIRSTQGMNNDYAALTEVLTRRFLSPTSSHEGDLLPDVCILDGGKGQLGVVKTLRETDAKFRQIFEKVHFISLGKGKARKKTDIGKRSSRSSTAVIGEKVYLFDEEFHIVEISLTYDQADTLLTKLRDEAHRFSNAYRKQQMKKQREALSASK
jgi:excinuclease ABC subunit C